MSKLAGKSVLITGAANGIGRCTAHEFAKAGSQLILTDIDAKALEELAAKLRADGTSVTTHVVDVGDRAQVEKMAADVLAQFGGLDVLINNAGVGHLGELADTPIETWEKLVRINLWGPLYHVYAFLPKMIERHAGQIVNVSSGQAFFRLPTWGAYAAIKLALGGFSEILHYEVRKHGVHVTTVYPFLVNTGFYKGANADTFAGRMSIKLMPYYSDTPEKVARTIFHAVEKERRVEMVNFINDIGFYARLVPPVASAISMVSAAVLGKAANH
jgi:short-subunit dehydrogenase